MQLSTSAFGATAQRADFYARVLEQVESLPGVERRGHRRRSIHRKRRRNGSSPPTAPPYVVPAACAAAWTSERKLSPRSERLCSRPLFFQWTMGPMAAVVIVNEAMAHRVWPGASRWAPVQARARESAQPRGDHVVGVVGDMRRQGVETEPIPADLRAADTGPSRLRRCSSTVYHDP